MEHLQFVPGYTTQRGRAVPTGGVADVTTGTKKVVSWLAIAFVAFYLITNPDDAAGAVRGAGEIIGDGFESLIQFFTSVFA